MPDVPETPLGDELQAVLFADDQVMSDVALYAIREGDAVADTLVLIAGETGLLLLPPQEVRQKTDSNRANTTLDNALLSTSVVCDMRMLPKILVRPRDSISKANVLPHKLSTRVEYYLN